MDTIDELSARRKARAAQMAAELASRAQELKEARRAARADRISRVGGLVNNNVKWLIGLITAVVCAWSLTSLGHEVGMPSWVGLMAALVIDGAWLYCLLQTHLNRDTPYRALGAYTTGQLLLVVSIACNLLHGFSAFGVTWKGALAGALFALFPIVLKVVVSQSSDNPIAHLLKVPGGRATIRQMGKDRAVSAMVALQQRDVIERYRIERATELQMAQFDLQSELELVDLRRALEPKDTVLDSVLEKDGHVLDSVLEKDGHVLDASPVTALTGQDAVQDKDGQQDTRVGRVYRLVDPRDGSTKYVGQTVNKLESRLRGHVKKPTNPAMAAWISDLRSVGLEPVIETLAKVPVNKLDREERRHIKAHARPDAPLLNHMLYTFIPADRQVARPGSDGKTLAELVRDLLDSGIKPEHMVAEVKKVRPTAKDHSITRTCNREIRSGNHI